tara:strand:- start:141 stop:371 length:231 start_codon:yes stop_codon:yes gene_type:complete
MKHLTDMDLIAIKSQLDAVNQFLDLVQMCPDDDMPKEVLDLVKAAAHISTIKCEAIEHILFSDKSDAPYRFEAGEA